MSPSDVIISRLMATHTQKVILDDICLEAISEIKRLRHALEYYAKAKAFDEMCNPPLIIESDVIGEEVWERLQSTMEANKDRPVAQKTVDNSGGI